MTTETTRLFNAAIGASAISASFELGLFDELAGADSIDIDAFCERAGLHAWSVASILEVLQCYDIAKVSDDRKSASPGPRFDEANKDKGYFLWLIRGYGNLLHNLATIVKNHDCTTDGIGRDGRYIAMAGRDYGANFVDPHFNELMDAEPFTVAADLGCGSANRLIGLAQERPDFRGVGVEVNKGAVDLARRSIQKQGLADRVTIVHSDVKNLTEQPEFQDVEVLFCFFMGHDLWPRPNCLKAFKSIKAAFPNLRRFLFSDTYRAEEAIQGEPPIFTLGFEFTHALMGQYIPKRSEWEELFEEAGWSCHGRRDIEIAYSSIFDLRPRNGASS